MDKKIIPFLSVLSVFGVLFMLNYTSPLKAGVVGVLIFFTMVFTILFGVMIEVVKIFQRILKLRNKKRGGNEERFSGNNRTYAYAAILAFGPLMLLLLLRTHGELQFPMIFGTIFLVLLGCFWVYKKA